MFLLGVSLVFMGSICLFSRASEGISMLVEQN